MKPSVLPVSPKAANKILRRSMIQLPGGKRDFSGVDTSVESLCDAKTLERYVTHCILSDSLPSISHTCTELHCTRSPTHRV